MNGYVEMLSGLAHQGLSIEPATYSLTALLETTDHFKTLDFWVRKVDLLGALRLKDPSLSIRHGESNRIFSRTNGHISHEGAVH